MFAGHDHPHPDDPYLGSVPISDRVRQPRQVTEMKARLGLTQRHA